MQVFVDLPVRETKHPGIHTLKNRVSPPIGLDLLTVMITIQLNDETGRGAVEIDDESRQYMLSAKVESA